MLKQVLFLLSILCCPFQLLLAHSLTYENEKPTFNRIYIDAAVGYGNTNWSALVPDKDSAAAMSTPISATDSGVAYGAGIGYYLSRHFTFGFNYMRFPLAVIKFNPYSFYYPVTKIHSYTGVLSFVGKFIVPISTTQFSAFATTGFAMIHRSDPLADINWRPTPNFGAGVLYDISSRWQVETSFDYYAGYGKSETLPVNDFIPFLYSLQLKLAYRFYNH